jgi:rRNA-processing protein FCF1
METLIIILLLVIAAEATYLVAVNTKKSVGKKSGRPIFVDTSVLIDGRITAVAQSGFMGTDTIFIPRSVIGELQYLADNADSEKRSRARHGLDIVTELQNMPGVKVEIFQDGSKAEEGVDERLLKLAKQYSGVVCTIDYNLNKVAQTENITVLNVNDLAMSLRMAYLPGEKIMLELTQKGNDSHQAVGHLTDGTMVVVERASKLIGQTAEIEFIRSLQTAAGKMMFAKLVEAKKAEKTFVKKERPVIAAVKKKFVKPQQQASPQTESAPEIVMAAPVSFHSDKNDQRLATRAQSPQRGSQPRQNNRNNKPRQQNTYEASAPSYAQPKPATKKPRTSAQNENDLINLLNSQ